MPEPAEKSTTWPLVAVIAPDSPRYQDWIEVFGVPKVPIKGLFPVRLEGREHPSGTDFYQLDPSVLNADQRRRLIEHIGRRFRIGADEVERDLADPNTFIPILADDISVLFDARIVL